MRLLVPTVPFYGRFWRQHNRNLLLVNPQFDGFHTDDEDNQFGIHLVLVKRIQNKRKNFIRRQFIREITKNTFWASVSRHLIVGSR